MDRPSILINEDNRTSHLGFRWPTEFDANDLDNQRLTELWDACQPFVVKNAISLMTPQAFLSGATGDQTCRISYLNADEWVDSQSTLQEYFWSWEHGSDHVLQVKVCMILLSQNFSDQSDTKDYPRNGHLHEFHPTLFNSFQTALQLMMPSHTLRSGGLNLVSTYPVGSTVPDLGNVSHIY
jgi:hypothetical protein